MGRLKDLQSIRAILVDWKMAIKVFCNQGGAFRLIGKRRLRTFAIKQQDLNKKQPTVKRNML